MTGNTNRLSILPVVTALPVAGAADRLAREPTAQRTSSPCSVTNPGWPEPVVHRGSQFRQDGAAGSGLLGRGLYAESGSVTSATTAARV